MLAISSGTSISMPSSGLEARGMEKRLVRGESCAVAGWLFHHSIAAAS